MNKIQVMTSPVTLCMPVASVRMWGVAVWFKSSAQLSELLVTMSRRAQQVQGSHKCSVSASRKIQCVADCNVSKFSLREAKLWRRETCSDVIVEIHTNPAQCSQKVGFRYVISWKLWMKPGPILHWSSGLARRKYAIISSLLINPSLDERQVEREKKERRVGSHSQVFQSYKVTQNESHFRTSTTCILHEAKRKPTGPH